MSDIESAGLKIVSTGGILLKMLSNAQMDWFLRNGLWERGGFGWGRVGQETAKDWKAEFCRTCYEIGKGYPDDCNVIYAYAKNIELMNADNELKQLRDKLYLAFVSYNIVSISTGLIVP